jgi:hypothetical protein
VKTTSGSARTPFFLTRNEANLAVERPEHWRIYGVHLFAKPPPARSMSIGAELPTIRMLG